MYDINYKNILIAAAVGICLALLYNQWKNDKKLKALEGRMHAVRKDMTSIQQRIQMVENVSAENDVCMGANFAVSENKDEVFEIDSNCSLGTLIDSDSQADVSLKKSATRQSDIPIVDISEEDTINESELFNEADRIDSMKSSAHDSENKNIQEIDLDDKSSSHERLSDRTEDMLDDSHLFGSDFISTMMNSDIANINQVDVMSDCSQFSQGSQLSQGSQTAEFATTEQNEASTSDQDESEINTAISDNSIQLTIQKKDKNKTCTGKCSFIITRGANKGKICGVKAYSGKQYCHRHHTRLNNKKSLSK